jgi:hypothetical protein
MHLTPQVVGAADWNPEATCRSKQSIKAHAVKESWKVGPVGRDEWVCAADLESLASFSLGEAMVKPAVATKARASKDHLPIAV